MTYQKRNIMTSIRALAAMLPESQEEAVKFNLDWLETSIEADVVAADEQAERIEALKTTSMRRYNAKLALKAEKMELVEELKRVKSMLDQEAHRAIEFERQTIQQGMALDEINAKYEAMADAEPTDFETYHTPMEQLAEELVRIRNIDAGPHDSHWTYSPQQYNSRVTIILTEHEAVSDGGWMDYDTIQTQYVDTAYKLRELIDQAEMDRV